MFFKSLNGLGMMESFFEIIASPVFKFLIDLIPAKAAYFFVFRVLEIISFIALHAQNVQNIVIKSVSPTAG
jgi:hypothetical protein